jgi:Flp pilus assembly protein TadG
MSGARHRIGTKKVSREMSTPQTRRHEAGQALVVMAIALVALLAMTGLIIDGGNAWAQQRNSQNASDAAAEAGAAVVLQDLAGASSPSTTGTCPTATTDTWDLAVCQAVYGTASNNGVSIDRAYYTNVTGAMLESDGDTTTNTAQAARVGGGSVPKNAQGVKAYSTKTFSTFFAGIVGINSFTATTQATAVGGQLSSVAGGGALPVTFPIVVSTCDGTGSLVIGKTPWPITSPDQATADNESIVPLCKTGPGSVGWLDYNCGETLSQQILNPCPANIDLPTWLETTPGNPNNVDSEVNTYDGQTVLIPLFDGTCKNQPAGSQLSDCTAGAGVGNNTWYHIPQFVGFLLDHAYIQGNNHPECNESPGQPFAGGNGSNGCLKGWFVKSITQGPVIIGQIDKTSPAALGIQLIH